VNWKLLIGFVLLLMLACSPIYAGRGTAYFILQPFDASPDYDVVVCNNQRKHDTYPPFDTDQVNLAYYNTTSVQTFDNAILRQFRAWASDYYLRDGSNNPVPHWQFSTYLLNYQDIELAYKYAEWMEQYNGDWDGVYLDDTFEVLPQRLVDSLTTYTGDSEVQVRADHAAYRDALIDRLRRITNDRYVIVANCGYPPLIDANLSGITVESAHVTTQVKIDETESAFRGYLTPGSGFHSIAWEWDSFPAHAGTIAP
jgi:hypothetical protein